MIFLFLIKSLIFLELLSYFGFSGSQAQDGVANWIWHNSLTNDIGRKRDIDRERVKAFRIMAKHIGPSMTPSDGDMKFPNYDTLDFEEKKVDTLREIQTTVVPKQDTGNLEYSNYNKFGKNNILKKNIGVQPVNGIKLRSEKNIYNRDDEKDSLLSKIGGFGLRNTENVLHMAAPLNDMGESSSGKLLWNVKRILDSSNFVEVGNRIKSPENESVAGNSIFYVPEKNDGVSPEVSSAIFKKYLKFFFQKYRVVVAIFLLTLLALLIMFIIVIYKLGQLSQYKYKKVRGDDYPPEDYKTPKSDGFFRRIFKWPFGKRKGTKDSIVEKGFNNKSSNKESSHNNPNKYPPFETNHLNASPNFELIPFKNDINPFETVPYPANTKDSPRSITQSPPSFEKPEIPHFKSNPNEKEGHLGDTEPSKGRNVKKEGFSPLKWIRNKFSGKHINITSSSSSEDSLKENNKERGQIINLSPEEGQSPAEHKKGRYRKEVPVSSSDSETPSDDEAHTRGYSPKRKRHGKRDLTSDGESSEDGKANAMFKHIVRKAAKYKEYLMEKERRKLKKVKEKQKQKRAVAVSENQPSQLNSLLSETTFEDVPTLPASEDSLISKIVKVGDCKPIDDMLTGNDWEKSFYTGNLYDTISRNGSESHRELDTPGEINVGAKKASHSQPESETGVKKKSSSVNSLEEKVDNVIRKAESMIQDPQPIPENEYQQQIQ